MKNASSAAGSGVAAKSISLRTRRIGSPRFFRDRPDDDAVWEITGGAARSTFCNGGSAALASHLACDIGKGTVAAGRKRLRTVALTDNVR